MGAGWDDALIDLYRSQRLPLLRLAVLPADDPGTAEDVVQDAFVALQRRWRAVDPAAAAGYLRTSVVNGVRTLYRRRSVARRHLHAVRSGRTRRRLISRCCSPRSSGTSSRALRTLPRRQREVLVLRYWSELSEAEIADALGVARGTVKSTASRGLQRSCRSIWETAVSDDLERLVTRYARTPTWWTRRTTTAFRRRAPCPGRPLRRWRGAILVAAAAAAVVTGSLVVPRLSAIRGSRSAAGSATG